MQQIERYGVIALLFLLVTIVVVALWDGGDPAQAAGGDQIVQVDDPRAKVAARPATDRPTVPERRTRAQIQKPAQDRPALNYGPQSQNSLDARARLLNPGGIPADSQAQVQRPSSRGNRYGERSPQNQRPTTQPQVGNQPVVGNSKVVSQSPPAYKTENRRPRDTNQWNQINGPTANSNVVKPDPVPAVREIVADRPKPQPAQGPVYVVQPGDSLARIARLSLGKESRWTEIQQLNGLKSDVVRVGMKLRLPAGSDVSSAKPNQNNAKSVVEPVQGIANGIYVVKSGDCLSKIAARELGSSTRTGEILSLNPGIKKDQVHVGQKLRMPAAGNVAASSPRKTVSNDRSVAKSEERYTVQ